jgi:MFS family permease
MPEGERRRFAARAARQPASAPSVRRAAERGLDALNLLVGSIQTGFGPFVAVYLATEGWTQAAIGVALSLGTLTAMASQVPAGALVDATRRKSLVALLSILAFALSALIFALRPSPLFIYVAEMLHGFSSCTLGPAIVAISLAIAGQAALGERLGRNVRYAAIGNGLGAALMGACGYYVSERAVFFLAAALTLPAFAAIAPLARIESAPWSRRCGGRPMPEPPSEKVPVGRVLADRRLLVFAACTMLFTLANSAMLPIASVGITKEAGSEANLIIAGAIVLPQVIVALLSPPVGRLAEQRGRRLVLLLGFGILPLRGLLLALMPPPLAVLPIQALDGIAAASLGVMVPLVVSDIAARSGHFNLCLGFVGLAIGVGATISTVAAGWIADRFGEPAAFLALALVGLVATVLVGLAMPETRPAPRPDAETSRNDHRFKGDTV